MPASPLSDPPVQAFILATPGHAAAHDHIARPASGRALAAAIPGATFVELPDAGHAVPIQCPGSVNDLLRRHWEEA